MASVDINEFIAKLVDLMQEYDPNLPVEETSAFRDILIDPHGVIMGPEQEAIEEYKLNSSLLNYKDMTTEALDAYAANFLVTRRTGSQASGTLKLFLLNPVATSIPEGTRFIDNEQSLTFVTTTDYFFSNDTVALNAEGYYYTLEIQVTAEEEGASQNLPVNTEFSFIDFTDDNIILIKSISSFTGGADEETNEDFYPRIKDAVSKRDLINARGASTILTENFEQIKRLTIIGKDEPEMERDYIYGIHVGGKIDYYVTTRIDNAYSNVIIQDLSMSTTIASDGEIPMVPLLRISSIELVDPLSGSPLGTFIPENDYTLEVEMNDYSTPWFNFSTKQDIKLVLLNPVWEHNAVSVTAQWNPDAEQIQEFVDDAENRTVNANPLVFNHIPVFISFTVDYVGGATETEFRELIYDYLLHPKVFDENDIQYNNVTSSSEIYIKVSDIVDLIKDTGARHVDLPITITAVTMNKDCSTTTVTDQDKIVIERTFAFYPDNIILNRRESE